MLFLEPANDLPPLSNVYADLPPLPNIYADLPPLPNVFAEVLLNIIPGDLERERDSLTSYCLLRIKPGFLLELVCM